MKKSYSRILSLLLVAIMLLSLVLTSCHNDPSNNNGTTNNTHKYNANFFFIEQDSPFDFLSLF